MSPAFYLYNKETGDAYGNESNDICLQNSNFIPI